MRLALSGAHAETAQMRDAHDEELAALRSARQNLVEGWQSKAAHQMEQACFDGSNSTHTCLLTCGNHLLYLNHSK